MRQRTVRSETTKDKAGALPPAVYEKPKTGTWSELSFPDSCAKRSTASVYNESGLWQTRKIETLFKLKDKNIHPSHVIYIGTCTCNQAYIGETARNLEVRVNEHSDINKQSEPAKHLKKHPEHRFTWDILTSAHSWTKRKIKEAFYIARFKPVLNKQVQSFHLTLYPTGTGIT